MKPQEKSQNAEHLCRVGQDQTRNLLIQLLVRREPTLPCGNSCKYYTVITASPPPPTPMYKYPYFSVFAPFLYPQILEKLATIKATG